MRDRNLRRSLTNYPESQEYDPLQKLVDHRTRQVHSSGGTRRFGPRPRVLRQNYRMMGSVTSAGGAWRHTEILHQALNGPGRGVTQCADCPPFHLFAVRSTRRYNISDAKSNVPLQQLELTLAPEACRSPADGPDPQQSDSSCSSSKLCLPCMACTGHMIRAYRTRGGNMSLGVAAEGKRTNI
jgi:hypothetical protein